jgi:hypothetical protein
MPQILFDEELDCSRLVPRGSETKCKMVHHEVVLNEGNSVREMVRQLLQDRMARGISVTLPGDGWVPEDDEIDYPDFE